MQAAADVVFFHFSRYLVFVEMKTENTGIEKTQAQARMLANRLHKRFRHLQKWAKRTGTGAFRLYDRDIPEIPLILDFYGGETDAGQSAAIAGALYERPYEKDDAEEARWLAAMKSAISQTLAIAQTDIFIKLRKRQRGLSQYEKTASQRVTRIAHEGGLRFKVNLSDYLDSGLFLDRRLMRAHVRQDAAGKRALNLFAYSGGFSVYAAAGGAASTDSVDLSSTYLAWAGENFALNGFAAGGRHRLIRADVRVFLERAAAEGRRWDLIVLDPPAFSNSKKMRGDFDLLRDYAALAGQCLDALEPGGRLWFSANARGFKTSAAELQAALSPRCKGLTVTDMRGRLLDEDFKGRRTPAAFVLEW
jgi:23S rRNA G2069 N7-methylase RlmK/C1962 C5-methylase RlmI